jgi:2-octaprenyl-6-methoxyphenol hydroxylase
MNDYDILIVGGGLVGLSLASALSSLPLKIGILEAKTTLPSDQRALALSLSSQKILATLGLWEKIVALATPIQRIHVSYQGRFGAVHLDAAKQQLSAYGYVIFFHQLMQVLRDSLNACKKVQYLSPAELQAIELHDDKATVTAKTPEGITHFHSKLVIGADGNRSKLRELLNISTDMHDYRQKAIVTTLELARNHENIAFERFTNLGTLALLPMNAQKCALVWTSDSAYAEELYHLSEAEFLKRVQQQFGYRLGRFRKMGARHNYPLQLIQATELTKQRSVLIGNSAQSLHPIAAQGFNLGLRDVALLAELLAETLAAHGKLCTFSVLKEYQQRCTADHKRTLNFSQTIVKTFSSSASPLLLARDLGLFGLDMLPLLKTKLAQQGMGLRGRLPKLVCGIPL